MREQLAGLPITSQMFCLNLKQSGFELALDGRLSIIIRSDGLERLVIFGIL